MKAVILPRYGSPETLSFSEVEKPIPGDDEVLVKVVAASLYVGDLHMLRPDPLLLRLAYGLRRPKHSILGNDMAGIVESVGEKARRFKPGDEVFGALPVCGFGALGVRHHCPPSPPRPGAGPRGAAGPHPGRFWRCRHLRRTARQSLRGDDHRGVQRIEPGVDPLPRGGLRHRLPTGRFHQKWQTIRPDPRRERRSVDRRLLACAAAWWPSRRHRRLGRPVLPGPTPRPLASLTGKRRMGSMVAKLLDQGKIKPVIDRSFPLADAPEAFRYIETGHARGKVVIDVTAG